MALKCRATPSDPPMLHQQDFSSRSHKGGGLPTCTSLRCRETSQLPDSESLHQQDFSHRPPNWVNLNMSNNEAPRNGPGSRFGIPYISRILVSALPTEWAYIQWGTMKQLEMALDIDSPTLQQQDFSQSPHKGVHACNHSPIIPLLTIFSILLCMTLCNSKTISLLS